MVWLDAVVHDRRDNLEGAVVVVDSMLGTGSDIVNVGDTMGKC